MAQVRLMPFGELFRRYRQPLYGFFQRRIVYSAYAEELTQETFLAVLRGASRYQPTATFRTYLYAVGFGILRSHRRKLAFRAMFRSEELSGHEPARSVPAANSLILRQAVGRLDALDREVLLLREFEELSYPEIATLLNLPLNTVRSRLFRARAALRDLLTTPVPSTSPAATFIPHKERV